MSRYQKRSTFSLVVTFIVAAIVLAGIISAARAIFFSSTQNEASRDVPKEMLLDTSASNSVSMYVRGPIVGNNQHYSFKMSVGPMARNLTTYVGYEGAVLKSINLANNQPAYEQFVYALERAKFTNEHALSPEKNDTNGICATGRVYYFSLNVDNKPQFTHWTSSCRGEDGSFRGQFSPVKSLFYAQFDTNSINILNEINIYDA